MFNDIKPFKNSLYNCINKTLEIKPDSIFDFEDLLVKNSIMHFIQEYINYSQLNQKDQVLEFLVDSLEKLKIQPLITNLGLLIKPIYQDQSYLNNLQQLKEIEVAYNLANGTDIQIKNEIDAWLRTQEISLDNQDDLYEIFFKDYQIELLIDYLPQLSQYFIEAEYLSDSEEEIEGSKEALFGFLRLLGIQREDSIKKSYLELVLDYLKL